MRTPEQVLAALLARAEPDANGCRLWTGCIQSNGYGRATVNRVTDHVHRHVYRTVHGWIPPGMDIRHTCDVRHCIAPEHLLKGTRKENMQDAVSRGRTSRAAAKITPEERAQIVARAKAGESYVSIAADYAIGRYRAGRIAREAGIRRNRCAV